MTRAKNFLEVVYLWILGNKVASIFILLFVCAGTVYTMFSLSQKIMSRELYVLERKNLEESVSLTGRVKPSEEAELSFEKTGVVKSIKVSVGDVVKKGQVIASLSGDDEYAKVLEAQASLDSQRAQLSDLTTGSKQENIDNKKAGLEKASSDIVQAYKNLGDSIRNISISGNSYVRDNLSTYFSGNLNDGYTININSCDSITEGKVNVLRAEAEIALKNIEKNSVTFSDFSGDTLQQDAIAQDTKNAQIKKITEYLNQVKNLFSTSCLTSNSVFDTSRTLISNSRNNWSALNTDISTKINTIENLKIAKVQAENDLKISTSGEKSEKINQQQAQVNAAAARVAQAQAIADKNVLKAPFDGVITNIDIKNGELVTPGGKSISIISTNNFEIESKVSEIDVAKIIMGATSSVTFDAYGDGVLFEAIVSNISPAGIISEGVPTYKTIFTFPKADERLRSGMTANINVVTKIHENTITIPAKFIINSGGNKTVNIRSNTDSDDLTTREVKVGALGKSGDVEILDGLNVGETVVIEK
jgi:HlyD family secretion protein